MLPPLARLKVEDHGATAMPAKMAARGAARAGAAGDKSATPYSATLHARVSQGKQNMQQIIKPMSAYTCVWAMA